MPRNVDLTQHYINIDTIVDAMVEEEKQHGESSSMILATYNEDTGSKIRRYQRNEEGIMNAETLPTENRISDKKKEEAVEEETQKEESNDCQKCPHKCNEEKKEKRPKGMILNGVYQIGGVDDGEFEEESDDGLYICEYCKDIGYSKKFKADICGTCTECETCNEYSNGDCDGCSYSSYRDGIPYSEKASINELLSDDDLYRIETVQSDTCSLEPKKPTGIFTILDY